MAHGGVIPRYSVAACIIGMSTDCRHLEHTADSFFDWLATRAADTLFVAISALILKANGWLDLLASLFPR